MRTESSAGLRPVSGIGRAPPPGAWLPPQPPRAPSRGPLHSPRLLAGSGDSWMCLRRGSHRGLGWRQDPPPGLDASPLRSAARPRAGSAQTPQLRSPPHASREPLGSRLSHQGREGHPPEEWALALRTHWVSDGPGTRGELATSACLDFSSDPAPPRSAQSPVGWLLRPRLVVPGSPPPGPGGPLSLTWPGSLLSGPPCTTH